MERILDFKKQKNSKVENSVQSILQRLANLVEKSFEARVDYLFFGSNPGELDLRSQLLENPVITLDSGCYFAIRSNKELVGAVHVDKALTKKDQWKVLKMIEMVVEFTITSAVELSSLESLEQNMKLLDPESNVIRMDHFHQRRFQLLKEFEKTEERGYHSALYEIIVDQDSEKRFKEAFDLHECSQRYAFFNINDLNAKPFESLTEFLTLGNLTIYVEDISLLQAPMQKFLAEYIELDHLNGMGPCIIFGSTQPLATVQTFIEPDLYKALITSNH